jgi:hypothetical protein
MDHDAEAWREPTFMRSARKGKEKAVPATIKDTTYAGADKIISRPPISNHTVSSGGNSMSTNSLQKFHALPHSRKKLSDIVSPAVSTLRPPSRLNKRDRDPSFEAPSRFSEGAESVHRKKRKIDAEERDRPSTFTPSGSVEAQGRSSMARSNTETMKASLAPSQAEGGQYQGRKLEGYGLKLKHIPRDNGNGPLLMGWDRYDAILLKLGRDRMPKNFKKGSN